MSIELGLDLTLVYFREFRLGGFLKLWVGERNSARVNAAGGRMSKSPWKLAMSQRE